jgi:hypothetical protein
MKSLKALSNAPMPPCIKLKTPAEIAWCWGSIARLTEKVILVLIDENYHQASTNKKFLEDRRIASNTKATEVAHCLK